MTANYTDTGIDLEIHDTATLTSLIWLRERVQSHIDAMTPTLAETIQAGPVQVVEPKSDPDCPRCKGTGLLPHVLYDPAEPCDCFGWGGEVPSEPEWSPWFDWSGGESPVKGCKVNTFHVSGVEDMDWANCFWWDHKPLHAFSEGNITRYRVLLSSIPEGCQLSDSGILRGIPKADCPESHKERTLPDGYVWAGYGDNGEVVQGSLVMRDEVEGVHIKEAKKCFKILFYAIPTNAPQADFDRFTGDRASETGERPEAERVVVR